MDADVDVADDIALQMAPTRMKMKMEMSEGLRARMMLYCQRTKRYLRRTQTVHSTNYSLNLHPQRPRRRRKV